MGNLIFGFYYMNVIGFLIFFVWILMFIKYQKKRSNISKILVIFIGLYVISLVLSILSFYNLRITDDPFEEGTYLYSIIFDNIGYFCVIFSGNYVFYRFYVEIFSPKEGENKKFSQFYAIFTIIGMIITLIPTEVDMKITSGLILLIHSMLLNIPITYRTFILYRKIDGTERWAIFSLFVMSFLFITLWVTIIIDMLWDETFGVDPENMSIWGFVIITIILGIITTAYLGFGLPKWFRKLMKIEL